MCTNITKCLQSHVLQETERGYQCQANCSSDLYRNRRMCVSQCPVDKFIMDRNCTDKCYGTWPFKYDATKCVSECPDEYFMHKNECLTAGSCSANGLYYTFEKTCYAHCPLNTFSLHIYQNCIPYDPSNKWNDVIGFLFIAVCLSSYFTWCVASKDSHVPVSKAV